MKDVGENRKLYGIEYKYRKKNIFVVINMCLKSFKTKFLSKTYHWNL